MRLLISMLVFASSPTLAIAGPPPDRTPVGSFLITPAKQITHVEMSRADFLPGQEMAEHIHPVPVVCFVTKGSFFVSIGALPIQRVDVGQTMLEPAGTVIHHLRNASPKEPAQISCAFLVGSDDKVLSVMLNQPIK